MMCNYNSDDSVSAEELEGNCSQKRECKQFKGRYICNWHGASVDTDVNYFTKSQDIYPSWKASISIFDVSQKENDSSVNVILGVGSEPKVKFKVVLETIDGGWEITSVMEKYERGHLLNFSPRLLIQIPTYLRRDVHVEEDYFSLLLILLGQYSLSFSQR